MRLILASHSPRRRELLSRITSDFEVIPSDAPEATAGSPSERVLASAEAKARAVARRERGIIIGADTIVVANDLVLEKPSSRDDARRMIEQLSGRSHTVWTGICVLDTETGAVRSACEETEVRFRPLDGEEIERYLDRDEHRDKAGAYGIQGAAAAFVEGIHGDYYNVVGLPICRLVVLLREIGMRL